MRRVVWLASCLWSLMLAPRAGAFDVVLDYTRLGTFASNTFFEQCAIVTATVDGSFLQLTQSIGLGQSGGPSDQAFDAGEVAEFTFPPSSTGIIYRVGAASNPDGDAFPGESFVEAFHSGGTLGAVPASGVGAIDVSALFGGAPIASFRVTPLESIRLTRAQYRLPPGDTVLIDLELSFSAPFQTVVPPLRQCGLEITSDDGDLQHDWFGIGVVGGADGRVNAGESLHVALGQPIPAVTYALGNTSDLGGTDEPGEHFVEAFGGDGASLGTRSAGGEDDVDLSALFDGAQISAFELLGVHDDFQLDRVIVTPEPAAGSAAALATLALLGRRGRTKQRAIEG